MPYGEAWWSCPSPSRSGPIIGSIRSSTWASNEGTRNRQPARTYFSRTREQIRRSARPQFPAYARWNAGTSGPAARVNQRAGRLNAMIVSHTSPSASQVTRNASSPHSGCPASVPYPQPAVPSSSTVQTTWHGAQRRTGPTPSPTSSRTPGSAPGAEVRIATPAARCIRQVSTASPATSNVPRPSRVRCRRWWYPAGSSPVRVAPISGYVSSLTTTSPGCSQVGQYGEDPPVVVGGRRQAQLAEDPADVLGDSLFAEVQGTGDRRVGPPLRHEAQHVALARGQRRDRRPVAVPGEQLRDHGRVDDRTPGGHLAQRGGEVGHVGHPVLEQVPDPGRIGLEQFGGVRLLDVLAEHQYRQAGPATAQLDRGAQPVVGVVRRHPHVGDD